MNRLELLCRPLIRLLCEYWCFAKAGAPVDAESFKRKIQICLSEIQTACENDPNLKREFSRIERPLIFFVDYTIKEGSFPFSREWREMARDYNELSGDEKFFDLLAENLDDPEASGRLLIFYLLMGLGFDGCYRGNADYVERRMKLCATRFPEGYDIAAEPLFVPAGHSGNSRSRKGGRPICYLLAAVSLFALASFAYNYYMFKKDTDSYRRALLEAVAKARPAYVKAASQTEPVDSGEKK